jgi:hypothetical protein
VVAIGSGGDPHTLPSTTTVPTVPESAGTSSTATSSVTPPLTSTSINTSGSQATASPSTAKLAESLVSFLTQVLGDEPGATLVGVSPDGQVRRVELDTGTVRTLPITIQGTPKQLLAVGPNADAIVSVGGADPRAGEDTVTLSRPDGTTDQTEGSVIFGAVDPAEFWVVRDEHHSAADALSTVRRWTFRNTFFETTSFLVPAAPDQIRILDDAVFYERGGSIYTFNSTTFSSYLATVGQFTDGPATRAHRARVTTCDRRANCFFREIDAGFAGFRLGGGVGPLVDNFTVSVASPDGGLRITSPTAGAWALTAVQSNTFLRGWTEDPRASATALNASTVAWTVDSKYVLLPTAGGIAAWNASLTEPRHLGIAPLVAIDLVVRST